MTTCVAQWIGFGPISECNNFWNQACVARSFRVLVLRIEYVLGLRCWLRCITCQKLDWTLFMSKATYLPCPADSSSSEELWHALHQNLKADYTNLEALSKEVFNFMTVLLKENQRMTERYLFCGKCCTLAWGYPNFLTFVSQALLDDGFSVSDVSQHHALDDAVVFLFRQILVRHQWGVVFGGWRWVHSLKPCVALDLFQRCSPLRIPL